jgi:hypothetical protein
MLLAPGFKWTTFAPRATNDLQVLVLPALANERGDHSAVGLAF